MPQHKNPCRECPFRKKSAPGWLGAHEDAMEIINIVRNDLKFPCHLQVNQIKDFLIDKMGSTDDDVLGISDSAAFEQAVREAPHCVGALAFMNNTAKLSRQSTIIALQREVGQRDDVFDSADKMQKHHTR